MTADMVSLKEYIVGRPEARLKRTWWTGTGFMDRQPVTRPGMSSGRQASGSYLSAGRFAASHQPGRLPPSAPSAHHSGTPHPLRVGVLRLLTASTIGIPCTQSSVCLVRSVRKPCVHPPALVPPVELWSAPNFMRLTHSWAHDQ